jgi:hypothetical protein
VGGGGGRGPGNRPPARSRVRGAGTPARPVAAA